MLRVILLITIITFSVGIMKSYAEEYSFSTRIIPEKLIENSEGTLQVYALHNNHVYQKKIENLVFSSTDSAKVQVTGIEDLTDGFITNIKLKSGTQGSAKIELAAPGFASTEIPITIYGNTNHPAKLLIKSTPSVFSTNGPSEGYFTVELTNNDGIPVPADSDITLDLTATNSKVLNLLDKTIIIKSGDYYAVGKFSIKQSGTSQIFASSRSFQSASTTITVNTSNSPSIQMFVYPQKINNFASSIAYVIVQLKDSTGKLMFAKENIPLSVTIVNPKQNASNSSPQLQTVSSNSPLTIQKGSYWGYAPIMVRAGSNGTFNVFISAPDGYLTLGQTAILTTSTAKLRDDKSARLDLLPMMATGKEELIGIMHLEDTKGNPIIASRDLSVEIDSSDPNSLTIGKAHLDNGMGVAPVFGKVGTTATSSISLHVVTYNDQTVTPSISLPASNSLIMVADPLVPKILTQSIFPIVVYLTDSSALTYFANDSILNVLSNDFFSTDKTTIGKGDSAILVNSKSLKTGTANLDFIADNYKTTASLTSVSVLPATLMLDYPNPVLTNATNAMAIQIFDANSNPMYAPHDINLKIISTNNQILPFPENVTIPKGQYYATFDVKPVAAGTVNVSILADDLPLATYDLTVVDIAPKLKLTMPTIVSTGDTFFANVTIQNQGDPVKDVKVKWKVNGAIIQNAESATNQNGTAQIALIPNSDSVDVGVNVADLGYSSLHENKIVQVNTTGSATASNSTHNEIQGKLKSFRINGVDPLPIIILGSVATGGILIKKKNILKFKKK